MKREWRGLTGAILAIALLAGAILPNDRALLDAAKRGDVVAVKQALKSGADVNAAQGDGLTALHIAAQEGRLDIATFEEDEVYDQKDAEGFIRLSALRLKIRAQRKKASS